MAAENFASSLALTLEHEGGFSNHPHDPGGATMKGITIATFRAWRRDQRATVEQLRQISDAEVRAIYRDLYWNAVQGDHLPHGIDHMVFDMGVNAGVRRSALQLQQVVFPDDPRQQDGMIGPITLARTRTFHGADVIEGLGGLHDRHYRSLATFPTFGRGWLNRLDKRLQHARGLHRTAGG